MDDAAMMTWAGLTYQCRSQHLLSAHCWAGHCAGLCTHTAQGTSGDIDPVMTLNKHGGEET
jgi:hypothetical protein